MTTHQFIFSKRVPVRYYRYVAFWLLVYLFFVFGNGISAFFYNKLSLAALGASLKLFIVLILMLTTYPLVYKVIPGLARPKNKRVVYIQIIGIFILSYVVVP